MHHAGAFLGKDLLQIKVLGLQCAANLAGAVVVHPGAAHAESGIRNVELMAISPGAALLDFGAFVTDVAAAQFAFDERGNGAAFHKRGEHLGVHSQRSRHIQHVAFGAGGLHGVCVADAYGLTEHGRNAHAHAGCGDQIVLHEISSYYIYEFYSLRFGTPRVDRCRPMWR